MPASVVPVIYDHSSKQVLRWYILDDESQLLDPAFNPANNSEAVLRILTETYRTFGLTAEGLPALSDLQNYVNANAP